jgi:NADH:ubiquinone oxidoreductase subunit C
VREFIDLKNKGARLITLVGVNKEKGVSVKYFFSQNDQIKEIEKRAKNDRLKSIVNLFPNSNFYERETSEMFGIDFTGHPEPKPLFLTDDLRKKKVLRK